MRKKISLLFIAAALLVAGSCVQNNKKVAGDGNVITETRHLGAFEELFVATDMHIYLSQGPVADARIEAESNLIPYIITRMEGDKLIIKTKNDVDIYANHTINIYLTTPRVEKLSMAGSGEINTQDTLSNNDEIKMSMAGSGGIHVLMNAPEAEANIAGSGKISVVGYTRSLDVNIAGSGDFKGADLKSEKAKVQIAGSGSAWVFASIKLESNILGSGNIHYTGNPQLETKTLGSGNVVKDE